MIGGYLNSRLVHSPDGHRRKREERDAFIISKKSPDKELLSVVFYEMEPGACSLFEIHKAACENRILSEAFISASGTVHCNELHHEGDEYVVVGG